MKQSWIRRWFLKPIGAGLLVLLPLGLAIMILASLLRFSDGILSPLIHAAIHFAGRLLNVPSLMTLSIPGLGTVVLVLLLYMTGVVSLSRMGKWVTRLADGMVGRLPLVGSMYQGARELVGALFRSESAAKRVPVLAEIQPGQIVVGFLTGETTIQQEGSERNVVGVYFPTTPNLASGTLMFLPSRQVTPLAMTMEEAMKLVVSGGLTVPPQLKSSLHTK